MSARRYVVIGAGAIGALLTAQLRLAGIPVLLVARGEALESVRTRGVRVARPAGVDSVDVPVVGAPAEAALTPDDVLVLAVKAQHAAAALADWAWQPVAGGGVGADLPVITFQNGLVTEPEALRLFRRVIGATIAVAAVHLRPGEVASPAWPEIGLAWIGGYPDVVDADQGAYARDLRAAGYTTWSRTDIRAVKAWKLLGNLGNALDLYTGSAEERVAARTLLVREAQAVYDAAGIRAAEIDFAGLRLSNGAVPGYPAGRMSTWQSFARGASSEVDHLNGEVVLLGRLHGVPTPVNELVQRTLGAHAARGDGVDLKHPLTELLAAREGVPL